MKFTIPERVHPNIPKYPSIDFEYAKKFSKDLVEELQAFVKAIILFGSTAREEKPLYGERDIDILVIVDDITKILSPEVVQTYRVITERVASKVSKRLHITTLKLTSFWDYIRNGDPIAINMLRDGMPLYDTGFFEPLQQLLFQGRIRPTREAIWNYFARAPTTLRSSEWHLLQATIDLYWAAIDSAHAALMKLGDVPPTPAHVADMIEARMVKTGLIPSRYVKIMRELYDLNKRIVHRELQTITGKAYDEWRKQTEDFVKTMQRIVESK